MSFVLSLEAQRKGTFSQSSASRRRNTTDATSRSVRNSASRHLPSKRSKSAFSFETSSSEEGGSSSSSSGDDSSSEDEEEEQGGGDAGTCRRICYRLQRLLWRSLCPKWIRADPERVFIVVIVLLLLGVVYIGIDPTSSPPGVSAGDKSRGSASTVHRSSTPTKVKKQLKIDNRRVLGTTANGSRVIVQERELIKKRVRGGGRRYAPPATEDPDETARKLVIREKVRALLEERTQSNLSASEKEMWDPAFYVPPQFPPCVANVEARRNLENFYFQWATLGMTEAEKEENLLLEESWIRLPCSPRYSFVDVSILIRGDLPPMHRRKAQADPGSWNRFKMDFRFFGESKSYIPAEPPTQRDPMRCNQKTSVIIPRKSRNSPSTEQSSAEAGGEVPNSSTPAPQSGGGGTERTYEIITEDQPRWKWAPGFKDRLPVTWNAIQSRLYGNWSLNSTQLLELIREDYVSNATKLVLGTQSSRVDGEQVAEQNERGERVWKELFDIGIKHQNEIPLSRSRQFYPDTVEDAHILSLEVLAFLWRGLSPRFQESEKYNKRGESVPWFVEKTCLDEDITWAEAEWKKGPTGIAHDEYQRVLERNFEPGQKGKPIRYKHAIWLPEMTCMTNLWHGFVEHVLPLWDTVQRLQWDPEEVVFIQSSPRKSRWGMMNHGCPSRNFVPYGWQGAHSWNAEVFSALFGIQSRAEFSKRVLFSGEQYDAGLIQVDTLVTGTPRLCQQFYPEVLVENDSPMSSRAPFYRGYDQHRYGPYCASLLITLTRRVLTHLGHSAVVPLLSSSTTQSHHHDTTTTNTSSSNVHDGLGRLPTSPDPKRSSREGENEEEENNVQMPPRLRCFLTGFVVRKSTQIGGGRAILNRDKVLKTVSSIVEEEYRTQYGKEWLSVAKDGDATDSRKPTAGGATSDVEEGSTRPICSFNRGRKALMNYQGAPVQRPPPETQEGRSGRYKPRPIQRQTSPPAVGRRPPPAPSNPFEAPSTPVPPMEQLYDLPQEDGSEALSLIRMEKYTFPAQVELMQQMGLFILARGAASINAMWLPEGAVIVMLNIADTDTPLARDTYPWNTFGQFLPSRTTIVINCEAIFEREDQLQITPNFSNMVCNETAVGNAVKLGLAILRGAPEAKRAVKNGVLKRGPFGSLYRLPPIVGQEGFRSFEEDLIPELNQGKMWREFYREEDHFNFDW